MYIFHGAWIPDETDDFIQPGAFYVWVETGLARKTESGYSVKYLPPKELEALLADDLGIASGGYARSLRERLRPCHWLLPGIDGRPLPSPELTRRLALSLPEDAAVDWVEQEVSGYALTHTLKELGDIYFLSYQREDVHLGQDLLFWVHYSQSLRQVLRKDQYIPALKYRPLPAKRKTAAFEIYPAWEIISEDYETRLRQALDFMPLACLTAAAAPWREREHYDPESLLRHFSAWVLTERICGTALPMVFQRKIRGSLIDDCHRFPEAKAAASTPAALARYQQWQNWRQTLAGQRDSDFQLGFQLLEAADAKSPWRLQFLAVSRREPSLKLALEDYWLLDAKAKAALAKGFGAGFESRLIQELGYAARMYPRLWQGLETDRPVGLNLSLDEVFAFLKEDAWVLEDAGCKVIVPAWWTPEGRRRAKLRIKTSGGGVKAGPAAGPGYFSLDALVSYRYELAIGDEVVSEQEWRQLVEAKTPLVWFRGQWVELERDQMEQLLEFWRTHGQRDAEMTLGELLHRAAAGDEEVDVSGDSALTAMLARLNEPARFEPIADPVGVNGTLRDYQKRGVAWIQYLESLGLNGCLADDMGLGKTLQVIVRLVMARDRGQGPTLLIAPTSVLGNWQKEIEKFAPQLTALLHHGPGRLQELPAFRAAAGEHDIVITSFTLARKDSKLLEKINWRRVVIDEAQNIKNPNTAQTKAILKLKARHRLALTGTPVENRLLDLWSIFNFLNPGYLGAQARFRKQFELPIQRNNDLTRSAALKKLVQPFILRRVKTDQAIIRDLPDKVEDKQYCNLTREQASLYEAVVREAERAVEEADGIQRKGLILSILMKLKQICNHPRQCLQDGSEFTPERSHKLERLTDMVGEAIAEEESLLVFTQFTDIGSALEKHLGQTYPVYYLHGGVNRTRRERMIEAFQDPDSEPSIFVLSLKAGGVGINLTRANHVFHFDRWWNPAVEDQATDRAFRIGQTRNVFVHKFVTLGTLEERIDQMIEDKKRVASAIVGADESWLTELDNDSFKRLIALNRAAVLE